MSDLQDTEDAVNTTINCASAKILAEMDKGSTKGRIRVVVLGELNGIRRYFIKLLHTQSKGPLSNVDGETRGGD